MKTCSKCGKELSLDNFYKKKKSKDGLYTECKGCSNERSKAWRKANPEYMNAYKVAWRKANQDRVKAYRVAWRKANPEHVRVHQAAWRKTRLDEELTAVRAWRKANLEKVRYYSQNRHARKLNLPHTLTLSQWEQIKKDFNNACCYCGEEKPLHQEHFLALSKGGEYSSNNIIPACKSCNSAKSNKDFFEWYPNFTNYSKTREKIILERTRKEDLLCHVIT